MLDSVLRGSESMASFMVATFADLFIRVILCYVLDPVLGIAGIWWSWPIGWGAATALSVILYSTGRWYKSERAKRIFAALAETEKKEDAGAEETSSAKKAVESIEVKLHDISVRILATLKNLWHA